MKVHPHAESSGVSLNTTCIVVILVSTEAAQLEFGGQILPPELVNAP